MLGTTYISPNKYVSQLSQNGLDTKVEKSRKQMKERKNRAKKVRGVKKVNIVVSVSILARMNRR